MPLPPDRRPRLFSLIPVALLATVMVVLPPSGATDPAGTHMFTAPLSCDISAPISTWFDHDEQAHHAVNWSGAVQNPRQRPFADGHNGTDYAIDSVPVLAIAPGVVRETKRDAMGALVVAVDHGPLEGGHQYQSRYVHLSSFRVTPGQTVARGQVVGISGNTGLSSGPHLHLTLLEDGHAVDPYAHFWNDGRAPCSPAE